jgi:hypothetical protein
MPIAFVLPRIFRKTVLRSFPRIAEISRTRRFCERGRRKNMRSSNVSCVKDLRGERQFLHTIAVELFLTTAAVRPR